MAACPWDQCAPCVSRSSMEETREELKRASSLCARCVWSLWVCLSVRERVSAGAGCHSCRCTCCRRSGRCSLPPLCAADDARESRGPRVDETASRPSSQDGQDGVRRWRLWQRLAAMRSAHPRRAQSWSDATGTSNPGSLTGERSVARPTSIQQRSYRCRSCGAFIPGHTHAHRLALTAVRPVFARAAR